MQYATRDAFGAIRIGIVRGRISDFGRRIGSSGCGAVHSIRRGGPEGLRGSDWVDRT
jgi:hypothetical protein